MAVSQQSQTTTVTISSGGSLSTAADLKGLTVLGVQMPAGWDAAQITCQGSADGTTYGDVYSGTTEQTIGGATPAALRYIIVPPTALPGIRYLKLRSGTGATPVNQTADRVLTIITAK